MGCKVEIREKYENNNFSWSYYTVNLAWVSTYSRLH